MEMRKCYLLKKCKNNQIIELDTELHTDASEVIELASDLNKVKYNIETDGEAWFIHELYFDIDEFTAEKLKEIKK